MLASSSLSPLATTIAMLAIIPLLPLRKPSRSVPQPLRMNAPISPTMASALTCSVPAWTSSPSGLDQSLRPTPSRVPPWPLRMSPVSPPTTFHLLPRTSPLHPSTLKIVSLNSRPRICSRRSPKAPSIASSSTTFKDPSIVNTWN